MLVCSAECLLHLQAEDGQMETVVSTFLSILAMNQTLSHCHMKNGAILDSSKGFGL